MILVTKKQFDEAVVVISNALQNGQVQSGFGEYPLNQLLFGDKDDHYGAPIGLKNVSFIAPDTTVKSKLFALRRELSKHQDSIDRNQKDLENMKKEEQRLIGLIAT